VALLAARIRTLPFDGIVPVPRHWRRVRAQGADPVYDLARALSRATGQPLWGEMLWRARTTPAQTELPPAARLHNPAGSFAGRRGGLRGKRVLLLDDVTTTGATLRAAARELRGTGAARRVLTVAFAGTPGLSGSRLAAL
jgi:predicted amidophosphoribosyltransferase